MSIGTIYLPRESVKGGDLPIARLLSKRVTWPSAPLSREFNTIMMQFGQFVAHDVAFTPNHESRCCRGRKWPSNRKDYDDDEHLDLLVVVVVVAAAAAVGGGGGGG